MAVLVWTPAVVPSTALNIRSCPFSGKISKTFILSWSINKISFSLKDSAPKGPITSINSAPVWATISLVNVYASLETPTPNAALSVNPLTLVDNPLILMILPLIKLWGVVTIPTNEEDDLDGISSTLEKLVDATLIVLTCWPPILLTRACAFTPSVPVLSKTTLSSTL